MDIGEDLLCTWKVSLVMQDNVIIFCNGFLFHHNHVLWSLCTDMNKLSLMSFRVDSGRTVDCLRERCLQGQLAM